MSTGLLDPPDFEAIFRRDADPWAFATRPYEVSRHRATAGLLAPPGRRADRVLELGAGAGHLSAHLAPRAERLVTLECSPTAAAAARDRLDGTAPDTDVDVRVGVVPADVPPGPFDVVVASEVLYYLGDEDLDRATDACVASLAPGGRLLAVHWTGHSPRHRRSGAEVHRRLRAHPRLRCVRRGGGTRDGHAYLIDVLVGR